MDFSKFKLPDWLMIGGAVGVLIFGTFLDWASFSGTSGNNAFDYFFTGGLAWILAIAVGIIAFLLAGGQLKPGGRPWPLILLAASALALLLMLLRLIMGAGSESGGGTKIDLDRSSGMYLTFVAVAVVAVGAFLKFQAGGGNISDLADMDKMRGAFKGNDGPPRA